MQHVEYRVTIRFQYPAHDERNGITYYIDAASKSEAAKRARYQATRDGHLPSGGRGRVTVTAELA